MHVISTASVTHYPWAVCGEAPINSSREQQPYSNIEYILIDGAAKDWTLDVLHYCKNSIDYFISEKDDGIYDAMNKGIKASTGDIIGILNSDDFYFN